MSQSLTDVLVDATIDATVHAIPETLLALHVPQPVVTIVERVSTTLAAELKKRVHPALAEQLPALLVPRGADLSQALHDELIEAGVLPRDTIPAPAITAEQAEIDDTDPTGSLLDRRHT